MFNRKILDVIGEGYRLKACAVFREAALEEATHHRKARQLLVNSVKNFAEGGEVAVVWNGRDCDGVRYHNAVSYVEATVKAVDEHIEHTYAWADGPCSYYITTPTYGRTLQYDSRDLVAEAFEDGHAHVIYD